MTPRPRMRAHPAVIALSVAALVACWAAALRLHDTASLPGSRFDAAWAARIDAHHTPARDALAHAIALVGGVPGGIVIDLLVAALVLLVHSRAACIALLTSLAVNEADVLALKWVSERRPPGSSGLYLGVLGSFPSGHTANAAVIMVAIGLLARRRLVWAGGIAYLAVMGVDRTYLDAHWVTDTLGGAIAGAAVTALVWNIARPPIARRRRAPLAAHAAAFTRGVEATGGPG